MIARVRKNHAPRMDSERLGKCRRSRRVVRVRAVQLSDSTARIALVRRRLVGGFYETSIPLTRGMLDRLARAIEAHES